jgi:carbon monoxide dehydrogenase subunit G
MGQITTSVELPAAPEAVWEQLSNPNNFEKWLTIHTKWKGDPPAQFSKGAQATEVVTMLGMANSIAWTVEEYEAPTKLVISGTGMAGVKTRFALSVAPSGDGSLASIEAEFSGQMIVGALGKAVEKDATANLNASLENLKKLLA